jgi:hypothetical protein
VNTQNKFYIFTKESSFSVLLSPQETKMQSHKTIHNSWVYGEYMQSSMHSSSQYQTETEKLTVAQLIYKFPAFYRTSRFTTMFTTALHLTISPYINSLNIYYKIILPPIPTPGLPNIILYAFVTSAVNDT